MWNLFLPVFPWCQYHSVFCLFHQAVLTHGVQSERARITERDCFISVLWENGCSVSVSVWVHTLSQLLTGPALFWWIECLRHKRSFWSQTALDCCGVVLGLYLKCFGFRPQRLINVHLLVHVCIFVVICMYIYIHAFGRSKAPGSAWTFVKLMHSLKRTHDIAVIKCEDIFYRWNMHTDELSTSDI